LQLKLTFICARKYLKLRILFFNCAHSALNRGMPTNTVFAAPTAAMVEKRNEKVNIQFFAKKLTLKWII
jgi:hypothetical protein